MEDNIENIVELTFSPNLAEELNKEHQNLSEKFGTTISNVLYTLYLDQKNDYKDDKETLQTLSNSFHAWWTSPHTEKVDKIAMLKDPKLWPFTDEETEALTAAINQPAPKKNRNMNFWGQYQALENEEEEKGEDLEKEKHAHHDVVLQIIAAQMRQDLVDINGQYYHNTMLGNDLRSLISLTDSLWEQRSTPKHPDVAQLRHLGYGLALTRLTHMDPTIDNAKKLKEYSDIVSGKGENVKFNQRLGILADIGIAIVFLAFFGCIIAAAIVNPATAAAADLMTNIIFGVIIGGVAVGGITAAIGCSFGAKASKTGLSRQLDNTEYSLSRRINSKHLGLKAPERSMFTLPGKPKDEKLNNLHEDLPYQGLYLPYQGLYNEDRRYQSRYNNGRDSRVNRRAFGFVR